MDCRTARHLLDYARPRVPELDRLDQEALDGHLAVCPECDSLARTERQLDDHLGHAVCEVPVPQGLRERLVQRLAEEREAWYRRQLMRGLRVVAVAAALLLVAWLGLLRWREHQLPRLDDSTVLNEVDQMHRIAKPDRDEAEAWFRKKGIRTVAPGKFDYRYLFAYHLAEFMGKEVPCLLFVRPERPAQFALVYVLTSKQFDLRALSEEAKGYNSDVLSFQVWRPSADFAYVVVYTGDLKDLLEAKG